MLMHHRTVGGGAGGASGAGGAIGNGYAPLSQLETIGELPEDESDRDTMDGGPATAPPGAPPAVYNKDEMEVLTDKVRRMVMLQSTSFIRDGVIHQPPDSDVTSDTDDAVIDSVVDSNTMDNMTDMVTPRDSGCVTDCDSSSSFATFSSSSALRQDTTPSPSTVGSHGSEDDFSASDDEYSGFQIQTFSLDGESLSSSQGDTRLTHTQVKSHANIVSSHHVFSMSSASVNTLVDRDDSSKASDDCVQIQVHASPPRKPTPPKKPNLTQKQLKKIRAVQKVAVAVKAPNTAKVEQPPKAGPDVQPLSKDNVKAKEKSDLLELKEERAKFLSEFGEHKNRNKSIPASEITQEDNKKEDDEHQNGSPQDDAYNSRLSTPKLSASLEDVSKPKPAAHQFVTEAHELEKTRTDVIASLPGAMAAADSPKVTFDIGEVDPEIYRHPIASSEHSLSRNSTLTNSRKSDSFKTALGKLRTIVRAENYLPRCSFYSSHDRALKSAGYNLKELESELSDEAETKKETKKVSKKTASVGPRTAWHGHVSKKKQKARSKGTSIVNRKTSMEITKDEYEKILDGRRESYGYLKQGRASKKRLKQAKERAAQERKQTIKNAKKIVKYLKLVKNHPEQYEALRQTGKPQETEGAKKVSQLLINMSEAYTRSYEHGHRESLVLQAAYELGHKHLLPVCAKHEQQEKKRIKKLLKATKKGKKSKLGVSLQKEEEEEKVSELERRHVELEQWLKTLTTAQMLKARELALKQMGESEHSMRKWWVTQKYCRYLRQPYGQDEEDDYEVSGTLGNP